MTRGLIYWPDSRPRSRHEPPRPRFTFEAAANAGAKIIGSLQSAPPRQWLITIAYVPADVVRERFPDRRAAGAHEHTVTTIMCIQSVRAPRAADYMPAGAMFVSSDTIEVSRMDALPQYARRQYAERYRHFLLWRRARAAHLEVKELVAGIHFDPENIDARVEAWVTAQP